MGWSPRDLGPSRSAGGPVNEQHRTAPEGGHEEVNRPLTDTFEEAERLTSVAKEQISANQSPSALGLGKRKKMPVPAMASTGKSKVRDFIE